MGGSDSAEFMVLTPAGEDTVARCTGCDFAANTDACECAPVPPAPEPGTETLGWQ